MGLVLAGMGALLLTAPVQAATFVYEFSTDEPFAGGRVAFTYRSDGPAPLDTFLRADALASATPGLASIRFSSTCFTFLPGQSASVACDRVEAFVRTSFGTTQLARLFADGALTAEGSYATLGGTPATLSVDVQNGGVPEPATWATMILGMGGMGGLLRRRGRALALA